MTSVHVDELLIDHARGELDEAEGNRVTAHLAACPECRATRERFAALLAELARTAPPAPPIHWGAYRAELRDRLERRRLQAGLLWRWVVRPAPALVAASLVIALVVAGLPGSLRGPGAPDPLALDSTILASQLDMFARLDVVQRLDLLEDFNVINELDELPEPSKS
ncbi:MAG TPA: zf-HC2 domain-containing protein [Candidatus Nitrosotalea sp.]|jgi:anti-sigma factor RsiW|nr:zf-HC2 domain-containing protein [Candidatus Nitrosotalea sp.]